MPHRHRSHDGHRETEDLPGAKGPVSQQGRSGQGPARDVGTRDEEKRATERPAGATRVRKADKEE